MDEYHQTQKTGPLPEPNISEPPPSLTYDTGASTTIETFTSVETAKSIPTTDTGAPSNEFEIEPEDDLDLDFTNWFNETFTQNKTNGLNYPLDPGIGGRML